MKSAHVGNISQGAETECGTEKMKPAHKSNHGGRYRDIERELEGIVCVCVCSQVERCLSLLDF